MDYDAAISMLRPHPLSWQCLNVLPPWLLFSSLPQYTCCDMECSLSSTPSRPQWPASAEQTRSESGHLYHWVGIFRVPSPIPLSLWGISVTCLPLLWNLKVKNFKPHWKQFHVSYLGSAMAKQESWEKEKSCSSEPRTGKSAGAVLNDYARGSIL